MKEKSLSEDIDNMFEYIKNENEKIFNVYKDNKY